MSFVRLPTATVSVLLGGVCAALLFVMTLLTTGNLTRAGAGPAPGPTLSAPPLPAVTFAAADDTAAADKPLFHVNRKPYEDRRTVAAAARIDMADATVAPFTLKGVLLSDGMARASLYSNTDGDIRWVNRGDAVDGWKLVQVRPANVVLARGDHSTTLALHPVRAGTTPD